MPLAVQTGATLAELMLRVAVATGVAEFVDGQGRDSAPVLPSSPSRLGLIRLAVQEGYQRFLAADPSWSFLRTVVQVRLEPNGSGPDQPDGDPSAVMLPVGVRSQPLQGWTVKQGDTAGSRVRDVPADAIIQARAAHPEAGRIEAAAIQPVVQNDGGVRYRAICWRKPAATTILEASFLLEPGQLAADTDRHGAGAHHDRVIAALAEAEFLRRDVAGGASSARVTMADQAAERMLANARAADARMTPAVFGRLGDTTAHARDGGRHGRVTNSDPYTVELPA